MTVVSLEEFETPALLKVKQERSRAEYCWTCTPWTIRHVLDRFHEPMCTYIDADMMFYSSPQYIFDDMRAKGCSTLITPHRLNPASVRQRRTERHVGTYCVEFNTFFNDSNGNEALNWWAEQCLAWCYYTPDVDAPAYGDQKYLNEFPTRFSGVYICEEWGAGIAGWNARQLRFVPGTEAEPQVEVRATGKRYPVVFVHFAGISRLFGDFVNANSGTADRTLHRTLIAPYFDALRGTRTDLLNRYGLSPAKRRAVNNNPLIALYQRVISPWLHLRRIADIYRLP